MNLPKILPDDDDPRSVKHWRTGIGLSTYINAAIVGLFVIPAMFVGVPKLGQLAWANDVDKKIQDATKPIIERLDKLESTVAQQVDTSNALLLELTEKSLVEMNRRRCLSKSIVERDYWQAEMNKLKGRYLKYGGGIPYEQRLCADL